LRKDSEALKRTPLSLHTKNEDSRNEHEYEILELDLGYQYQAEEAAERRSAPELL
jgi:hypothetical protein